MRTLQWLVVIAVLLGLGLAFNPRPGWAVGCCKCTGCSPAPAVRCFDTAGDNGDCFETCDTCPSFDFDAGATCGVGTFSDCLAIQGVQAPALGSYGIGLAAAALLAAGFILLARRARRAD
jgi:hypothetical protein